MARGELTGFLASRQVVGQRQAGLGRAGAAAPRPGASRLARTSMRPMWICTTGTESAGPRRRARVTRTESDAEWAALGDWPGDTTRVARSSGVSVAGRPDCGPPPAAQPARRSRPAPRPGAGPGTWTGGRRRALHRTRVAAPERAGPIAAAPAAASAAAGSPATPSARRCRATRQPIAGRLALRVWSARAAPAVTSFSTSARSPQRPRRPRLRRARRGLVAGPGPRSAPRPPARRRGRPAWPAGQRQPSARNVGAGPLGRRSPPPPAPGRRHAATVRQGEDLGSLQP